MKKSRRISADGKPRATGKASKRSKIWEVFSTDPNDMSKAVCNKCNSVISRGGGSSSKSQCTTNMWKHLENRHVAEFMKMKKYKETVHHSSRANYHPGGINKPTDAISIGSASDFEFFDSLGIWELFSVNPQDPTLIDCRECGTLSNSNEDMQKTIWSHIITKHPALNSKCHTGRNVIEKGTLNNGNRRSSVWDEFTQHPFDVCKVICNTCDTVVSRGQSKDRLNTTNMRRHLTGSTHKNFFLNKNNQNTPSVESAENCANGCKEESFSEDQFEPINPAMDSDVHGLRESSNDTETSACSNSDSVLSDRKVDLVHTGLLGNALYEQQKNGTCCDFSIILQYKSAAPLSTRNVQGNEASIPKVDCMHEYKIHSCIACIVSRKLKSVIQSGSDKFTLTDISRDAVPALIEIMYTGKLESVCLLKKHLIHEIFNLAQLLIAPMVTGYLKRCNPKLLLLDPGEHQSDEQNVISMQTIVSEMSGKLDTEPMIVSDESTSFLSPLSRIETSGQHTSPVLNVHDELNPGSNSNVPKVSKRKNYVPVANAIIYESIQYESADDIPSK